MKLRSRLFLLVAGAMIPLVLLSAVMVVILVEQEIETAKKGAMQRNVAFVLAVDAVIRGHFGTLQAMASSASLESSDLAAFRQEAIRVLASQPDWQNIILLDPNGEMVANALIAEPRAIPPADTISIQRVVTTQAPAVGNITFRATPGKYGVPIRVPVLRGGNLKFVLTAIVDPIAFKRLIDAQQVPASWTTGLIDSTGHFVARVPARAPTDVASQDFRDAVRSSSEGWYRGVTLDGHNSFRAHKTSTLSNWSVGLAIPSSEIHALGVRSATQLGVGALVMFVLAAAFAYVMARRIADPIRSLAVAAKGLARDADVVTLIQRTNIDEVNEVAQALRDSATVVHEREALRVREQLALKEADRVKNEFLAMLGHELRNPLAAITTSAYLLGLRKDADPSTSKAIGVIERQSKHMNRLIEDLLEVSRLNMGKLTIHPEAMDLAEAVTVALASWQQGRTGRSDRISLMTSSVWINADRSRIDQIIFNLLDNAEKFSPVEKRIYVSVGQHDHSAILGVRDEGQGIAADQLDAIFGMFVQGPATADRMRQGLGLGLALVKGLTEMHLGTVQATSDGLGAGATITVRLPVLVNPPPQTKNSAVVAVTRSTLRILLIEDNEDARITLDALLTMQGHSVKSAHDGRTGLEIAQTWVPDVVLMDIGLPDMTGYELAQQLRKQFGPSSSVRLIAMSGYGQAEDQRRAFEAGVDQYLTKPVSGPDLEKALYTTNGG